MHVCRDTLNMRLKLFTDYSLRMLIYLKEHNGRLCTIDEIAGFHDISKQHLMKVANFLALHGAIKSFRGNKGGLKLGNHPSNINIGSIVRLAESDLKVVECFDPVNNRCRLIGNCKLKHALHVASECFLSELDALTLNDL